MVSRKLSFQKWVHVDQVWNVCCGEALSFVDSQKLHIRREKTENFWNWCVGKPLLAKLIFWLVAFKWLSIVIIFWSVFLSLGFSIFNRVSTIQYLIEWVQYSTQTDRRCGTNRFVWTLHLLFNYQKSSKFCVCKKFSNFSFVFDFGTFHWFVWLWDISDIIIVFLEE